MHQFTDGFNSLALSLDILVNVVANHIDVVEEICKGRLDHVGLADTFVGEWIDDHLDTFLFQMHVDIGTSHHRVTVVMDNTRLAA